uniref:Uncharacterized protein n=1 Tax=Arundo donax TaxID=35708 RepID=A0A0A9HE87_ARUDO
MASFNIVDINKKLSAEPRLGCFYK